MTKDSPKEVDSPFDGVDPVSRLSLPEQVFCSLRDALMAGRFAPGQPVPLRSIALAMGISTMPVREAVNRLVATGALELPPNRRFRVPVVSPERYRDLTRAKVLIESSLAEENFDLITKKELDELESLHAQMCLLKNDDHNTDNVRHYLALNKQFHFTIYTLSKSKTLMDIIESLWIQVGPYFNLLHSEATTWNGDNNHGEIIKAIKEGNAAAFKQAVKNDLAGAADYIIENKLLEK